jgi:hypothetical protein
VKFSVCPSILLNNRECSPLGVNIYPRGQILPTGAKFTPKDEVHPWGPGVKLRMALWAFTKALAFLCCVVKSKSPLTGCKTSHSAYIVTHRYLYVLWCVYIFVHFLTSKIIFTGILFCCTQAKVLLGLSFANFKAHFTIHISRITGIWVTFCSAWHTPQPT